MCFLNIPNDTFNEIIMAVGSTSVTMSAAKVETAAVKDVLPTTVNLENALAAEFTITSGNKTITSFGGKALEAAIPVDN